MDKNSHSTRCTNSYKAESNCSSIKISLTCPAFARLVKILASCQKHSGDLKRTMLTTHWTDTIAVHQINHVLMVCVNNAK